MGVGDRFQTQHSEPGKISEGNSYSTASSGSAGKRRCGMFCWCILMGRISGDELFCKDKPVRKLARMNPVVHISGVSDIFLHPAPLAYMWWVLFYRQTCETQ